MSPYLRWSSIYRHFRRSKISTLGLGLVLSVLLLTLIAPLIITFGPSDENLEKARHSPNTTFFFGSDELGRDIFTRVLYGARISLLVVFMATILSISIGLGLGLVSGYLGGRMDNFIMRFVDITLAFPSLLLAIGISFALGRGLHTVIIALSAIGWASFARLVRGLVLSIKEEPFIEAAASLGSSGLRILFVHLLPHTIPMVIVLGAMRISTFILAEAGLSFLGLGVPPPTPSLGGMVSQGGDYIRVAPWMSLFPGGPLPLWLLLLTFWVMACVILFLRVQIFP